MASGEKLEQSSLINNNFSMAKSQGVITRTINGTESMMEEVAEQVVEEGMEGQMVEDGHHLVEEGHIVLEQDQQVVMVTEGEMGHQQIVITDGSGGFAPGTQVIQIHGAQGEQFVMDTRALKTEPEDLSVVGVREDQTRTINLEAGAQAIQASAAAAVQNVIRSLKDSDKNHSMLQQILPNHMLGNLREQSILIVEGNAGQGEDTSDNDITGSEVTPNKRSRTATSDPPRLQIAKQYTPFGYHCILEAPTAQWVRKDEDRCTYLNKGQFYGVTLEYRPNPSEPHPGSMRSVKSVVMLVFRDAKNPEDELNAWDFWHQRQPTSKQRIIDAETNNMSDQCGISHIEDVSFNAIAVYWNPLEKPAFISCAIQCLSTDFSLQKGVKGLPMHLQIDTYSRNPSDSEYDLVHRAYCQVKVFCDKGAERKFRQEERRAARKVAVGGQRVLEMYHQCQERSEFYSMVDLSRTPVLYTPQPTSAQPAQATMLGLIGGGSTPAVAATGGVSILKSNSTVSAQPEAKRRKVLPPPETRMVVYVRQENEEIFTPLHLVPPTVPGLARAIETKYNVSATAIRYLYRRNKKGITAKLDDDLLKFYCNEDTFLMQVTAIELEGVEGHESIMYDITLCELQE
eukprot:GFUD01036185.1.p1 GENE.GFUD01036185.1~~GFUD01036185.1.p1  ORF type:complete len:626 (+),score=183.78 GFUD01036185.1:84-1961(+)